MLLYNEPKCRQGLSCEQNVKRNKKKEERNKEKKIYKIVRPKSQININLKQNVVEKVVYK